MNKLHIRCKGGCGCGSGYFNNFQQAKSSHESDMWAYEMPHDYSPEQIDDATGKRTPLDKETGKPLHENTMKKSELKALIKEVVMESIFPTGFSDKLKKAKKDVDALGDGALQFLPHDPAVIQYKKLLKQKKNYLDKWATL